MSTVLADMALVLDKMTTIDAGEEVGTALGRIRQQIKASWGDTREQLAMKLAQSLTTDVIAANLPARLARKNYEDHVMGHGCAFNLECVTRYDLWSRYKQLEAEENDHNNL